MRVVYPICLLKYSHLNRDYLDNQKKGGMMSTSKTETSTIAGEYSADVMYYLLHRRSVSRKKLTEPGPSDNEIRQIIKASCRVSDHGKMFPWWFMIIKDEHSQSFSELLFNLMRKNDPEKDHEKLHKKACLYTAAPVLIAVISSPRLSKIPLWEQYMSAGAACQNLVLASNALGYGVNWLTEWYSYEPEVKKEMGLEKGENIAGFFSIGTAQDVPEDRARPDTQELTTYWQGKDTVYHKGRKYAEIKNINKLAIKGFELPNMDEEY